MALFSRTPAANNPRHGPFPRAEYKSNPILDPAAIS